MVKKKRAYSDTTIAVSKSREAIDNILRAWGVSGIQWEDQFDEGTVQLRFRWRRESGNELVARFRIDVDGEEELKEQAIDKRSGQISERKYNLAKLNQGKREHRLLLNLLKNMFEAIEEGIIPAEALLLPWIEDVEGNTVYDKVAPNIDKLSVAPLHKALLPSKE